MKETDLNRIIFRQFREDGGIGHKISDESSNQKPFDGFGVINGKTYFIESKFIKSEFSSFSFNLLEEHQKDNLHRIMEHSQFETEPLVVVGYFVPRKVFGFFAFTYESIIYKKLVGQNSIKKKELIELKEDYFIEINRCKNERGKYVYYYDIEDFVKKIIRPNFFIQK